MNSLNRGLNNSLYCVACHKRSWINKSLSFLVSLQTMREVFPFVCVSMEYVR